MNEENVPYTRVKNREYEARFTRPAYYELTKYLKQEEDRFYIEIDDAKFELEAKK
jgi:hypothetical protein